MAYGGTPFGPQVETATSAETLSWWKKLLNYAKWPFAILLAVVVVIFLTPLASKTRLNLGGILGLILGSKKKPSKKSIEVANTIPSGRIQELGIPDENGWVQVKQEKFDVSNNPFRDKSKVVLQDGTTLELSPGLQDSDVEVVYSVHPEVAIVVVKDSDTLSTRPVDMSGVDTSLLRKRLESLLSIFLLATSLMFSTNSFSEELVEIPKADLEAMIEKLKYLEQLEAYSAELEKKYLSLVDALPEITFDPFVILEDRDGRVFIEHKIKMVIRLAHLQYSAEVELPLTVSRQEYSRPFFDPRVKLVGALTGDGFTNFQSTAGIMVEPIHIGPIGLNGIVSEKRFGLALSVPLFWRVEAFAGAGSKYSEFSVDPIFGISVQLDD